MTPADLTHLAILFLPAVAATVLATGLAARIAARVSLRWRLSGIALIGVAVSLLNLGVFAALMFVSNHDAALVGILMVYSAAAGVGAALALARSTTSALDRLRSAVGRLADGGLGTRIGTLGAGAELDALARAVDEMAARLQASISRERAAEAKRRDLVTAVSHDLRTPLAGLRATVEAIEDGVVDDPPSLRRYVAEMRRSVDSLVVLIDDLFELVQLDAGAIEAESERIRLDEVVRSAVAACESQAHEKGLVIETALNGADAANCSPRVTRVLQNLLQNAIRHTPADGSVRVTARRGTEGLEVVVEDTGEGIPPEALLRVFEPFWRGDPARTGAGTGLGLALSKRIVEALGGDIRVESEPDRGSRFAVLVPDRR
jgi:signal transduction histidine kinase